MIWRAGIIVCRVTAGFFERSEHYKGFDYSKRYGASEHYEYAQNSGDPFASQQEHTQDADNPKGEHPEPFDPWRVLGISPGSTQAEIQKAFRDQVKLHHPDKVSHLGKDLREVAERKTKDINRAYAALRKH